MISLKNRLLRYVETLRFPWLLLLTTVLFVLNLFVPDALPFVDELLLALIAVLLARIRRGRTDSTRN